jgi:hypothetical protein
MTYSLLGKRPRWNWNCEFRATKTNVYQVNGCLSYVMKKACKNKYLKHKTLSQVEKKAGDSHFWESLKGIKDKFIDPVWFRLKNGTQIRLWEDKWLGNEAFKTCYPNLYNVVRKKQATVNEVLHSSNNVSF